MRTELIKQKKKIMFSFYSWYFIYLNVDVTTFLHIVVAVGVFVCEFHLL